MMLPFIALLIAAVVTSVCLRLLLKGNLPTKRRSFLLTGLLLVCLGLFIGYVASHNVVSGRSQKTWPTVHGIVLSSIVTGERAIAPTIAYQYSVDGKRFEAESHLRVPMFGGKRKKLDVASKHVAEYHAGDTVTVYYNPSDRTVSTLTPGPVWSDYGQLGAAWFILVIGFLMFLLPSATNNKVSR